MSYNVLSQEGEESQERGVQKNSGWGYVGGEQGEKGQGTRDEKLGLGIGKWKREDGGRKFRTHGY